VRPLSVCVAQLSLEVLKAWQSRAACPEALSLVSVHVGVVELLELLAHTLGRQAFSDLLFLRFPTVILSSMLMRARFLSL